MMQPVRVLVVDDSSYVRSVLSRILSSDSEIEVIGSAVNGVEAIEKIRSLKPDVVTMDVNMPRMDGLTALKLIMSECPTPVLMVSSPTDNDAGMTVDALQLGAADFFLKPSISNPTGNSAMTSELIRKVKTVATISEEKLKAGTHLHEHASTFRRPTGGFREAQRKVVVIGCSTGGPQALCEMVPALPADIRAAILIVQHMPPGFTRSMAERLDSISSIQVKEAQKADAVTGGLGLVAPGGFHMCVDQNGRISLNQDPPVWGVRPSVDVTMESAARVYGADTLGVVLTGMGTDGTRGASLIRAAGGKVLAEDQTTCTIFGMPKSVIEAGCSDMVVPLHDMAKEITELCR